MSWLINVKIAVLAPMPKASESRATARKTGDLRRVRREYRKSCRIPAITLIRRSGKKVRGLVYSALAQRIQQRPQCLAAVTYGKLLLGCRLSERAAEWWIVKQR